MGYVNFRELALRKRVPLSGVFGSALVMLARGQSNAERTAPQTLIRADAEPPFLLTPSHPYYSTATNGDGTYDVTFEGETSSGVRVWLPDTETVGPAEIGELPFEDGFNNVALGLAHRFYLETGIPVVLILIAEGSRPIERFVPSSVINITGITKANPCVVTIDDVRMFCQNSAPDYSNGLLRFPIRIEGVAGMTELNGNTYTFRARNPDFTATRASAVPVPGTIELYEEPFVNLVSMVDSSAFGTYTSGGVIHMHHLLDRVTTEVPLALAAIGATSIDIDIDVYGEANAGATVNDLWSTVGGICTYDGYRTKRLEARQHIRSQAWCRPDTRFLSFELARVDTNAKEKPRNDVIDSMADSDPFQGVVSSEGYETVADPEPDYTHFADGFGYGYNAGYAALAALMSGTNRGVLKSKAIRDLERPDGSLGARSIGKPLSQETFDFDLNGDRGGRQWLTGQLFSCAAALIVVPPDMNSTSDIGGWFEVSVYSTSGTTPGRTDGKTRVMVPSATVTNVVDDGAGHCRYTAAAHGFTNGETITVKNVVGVPGANTSGVGTVIDVDTFDIDTSTFSGAYTSGGDAWNVAVTFTNLLTGATSINEYIFQDNVEFSKIVYSRSNNWGILGDAYLNGYYSHGVDQDTTFRPFSAPGTVTENGVIYVSGNTIRFSATLGSNRTLTLPTNSTGDWIPKKGMRLHVVRTGPGASTLSVGGLKTLAQNTWCIVEYTGSVWQLIAYGAL